MPNGAAIGIAGLGAMGGAMMERLLLAAREAHGYNRTKAKAQPYIDKGMRWADSPAALVQACDTFITMVTDDAALAAVTEGAAGILAAMKPGKTWIEMSTISPDAIRALDAKVHVTGGTLVDAAVLGSPLTIQQGNLLVMLGGDAPALERAKPALLDIGPNVRNVGSMGHAKVMKIALNLNLPVQILALSEGVLLAEKSGIKREVALDVMLSGVVASPMLAYRAPFILDMPEKAWFDVGMMQKDLNLALDLGQEVGVPLPTTSVANEMLTAARAMGLQAYDFAVLFHALARIAGVDSSP